jgi:hypothetical protein
MRFGPFEILRPLGRGGMAETFLAVQRGPDGFSRNVCLKRVRAERAEEPDFVRGFQREARLASRLSHPNIARVFDFGCEAGTWWMALELVPGGDLRALLRNLGQPMPVDLGLLLAIDMLGALSVAHEAGIVHRDVSPSNILLDAQGYFKLADFGIAKATHADRQAGETGLSTTTGTIKGKAAYMAPEQALGLPVDGRADLWALGVVLFEAFAGVRPFDGPTDLAIMMAASQGRRRPVSEAAPHVPPDLCEVVERLLVPDREARFQSAGEVLEALSSAPPSLQARRRLAALLRAVGAISDEAPARRASPLEAPAVAPVVPAVEPPAASLASAPAPAHASGRRAGLVAAVLAAVALAAAALVAAGAAVVARPATEPAPLPPAGRDAPAPLAPRAPTSAAEPTPAEPPLGLAPPPSETMPGAPVRPRRTRSEPPARPTPTPAPQPAPPPPSERGTLHLTVIPWGDVAVDGVPVGRSPVSVPLSPGAHRVAIVSESGTTTRQVHIDVGRTTDLEVDLTDEP